MPPPQDDSPLATLVAASTHILVARHLDPPFRVQLVPVPGGAEGNGTSGAGTPASYRRTWSRFEVLEVLKLAVRPAPPGHPARDGTAAGAHIDVREADADSRFDLHAAYERHGFSATEEHRRHTPAAPVADGDDRIIFCVRSGGAMQFTVDGAVEGLAARPAIEGLL